MFNPRSLLVTFIALVLAFLGFSLKENLNITEFVYVLQSASVIFNLFFIGSTYSVFQKKIANISIKKQWLRNQQDNFLYWFFITSFFPLIFGFGYLINLDLVYFASIFIPSYLQNVLLILLISLFSESFLTQKRINIFAQILAFLFTIAIYINNDSIIIYNPFLSFSLFPQLFLGFSLLLNTCFMLVVLFLLIITIDKFKITKVP